MTPSILPMAHRPRVAGGSKPFSQNSRTFAAAEAQPALPSRDSLGEVQPVRWSRLPRLTRESRLARHSEHPLRSQPHCTVPMDPNFSKPYLDLYPWLYPIQVLYSMRFPFFSFRSVLFSKILVAFILSIHFLLAHVSRFFVLSPLFALNSCCLSYPLGTFFYCRPPSSIVPM
ncbi:hypothetical protein C8R43DRAFT_264485, partial [Mycena crocata]